MNSQNNLYMKHFSIPIILFLLFAIQFNVTSHIQDNPTKKFDKQWAVVDSLENIGQPKTAIKIVEKILKNAIAVKADAEIIKAIIYKLKLSAEFKEGVYEENIKMVENYINKTTFPNSAILHSIVAEMYWQYFSQNRYKILARSVIAAEMNENFDTWDEKKFARKIIAHYNASLQQPGKLSLIDIGTYQTILKTTENNKIYRPTLLDFLAYRALEFYQPASWDFPESTNRFILNQPQFELK